MPAHINLAAVASEFEADILTKNLSLNGIPALQFSAMKFSHFCSLTDDRFVTIFVKAESIKAARGLIDEMDLGEFIIKEGGAQ